MGVEPLATRAALMVYLEPTPYVLALIRRVTSRAGVPVDVFFVTADLSQQWNLSLDGVSARYLPAGTFASCKAIAGRIFSGTYGIVHLAGWGHPVLFAAMLLARLKRIPVAVETDTTLPVGQRRTKGVAKRLLYPAMLRIPSLFLPGGTRQKRYLQHYGVPEHRIVVAQMTVDVAGIITAVDATNPDARQARRTAWGCAPDDCVFLFVGRIEPEKGIGCLLEAFAQTYARCDKVALVIAGDGALCGIVELAQTKSQRIRWLGRLTGDALWNAYASADVLVLPSLFEPWGLVVNEAMAASLPVIASDRVGCVDDLVVDGETGSVVESESLRCLRTP